jgi:prephenate dehydratase
VTIPTTPVPRVAFQGEFGAFSEMALHQQWPNGVEPIPSATFPEALARVLAGDVHYAIVPVENAIVGRVKVALDALEAVGDAVEVRAETRVPVHLCLLAPRGATLAELRDVHSHPVALAQCRIFFARHSWLVSTPHADTAGAARDVAAAGERTRGAVASAMAAERYGLEIIARHIEDVSANWTRFVVVSKRD